jgi:hypothetical protein
MGMRDLRRVALLALSVCCSDPAVAALGDHSQQRIWYEHPVAEATAGYDAANNRTLINSYDIVAYGPNSVELEIKDFVYRCVDRSALTGIAAFYHTPSPEIGARIAAAWSAFHGTLQACLTVNGAAKSYIDKFELGYINRGRWIPGLVLKFTAETPAAKTYTQLHNLIKDKLPDPVNKVVQFYIQSQQFPSVNIRVDPPPGVRHIVAQFPDPSRLRHFSDEAQALAKKRGKELADSVRSQVAQATQQLGSEVAKAGQKAVLVPIQLAGEAAKTTQQTAPTIVRSAVPVVGGDGKLRVPILPGVPGTPSISTNIPAPPNPTMRNGRGCFGFC